jgi:hypothetical protein
MLSDTPLNILIDSWSTQAMYQQEPSFLPDNPGTFPKATGMRLNTVLGAMHSVGLSSGKSWNVKFSTQRICARELADVQVYVSFTRYLTAPFAYSDEELGALTDFVRDGGGILLMTNHGPFRTIKASWPVNDAALARRFGIILTPFGVDLSVAPLGVNPKLSYIANQVQNLVAHDSCLITPPPVFTPIAVFPASAAVWNGDALVPPASPYFSILVPHEKGNVIVVGNSGMMGDYGTPHPSCGLAPMHSNLMFFLNCVGFLGGLTQVPAPGKCPG